jgi:CRP/FNR family transcriptional regulator, dissimilatory nitrate respiration regulator
MPVEALPCIQEALSKCALFDGLAPPTLARLTDGARLRKLRADNMVVHRGDRPGGMFVLAEGEVKLYLISNSGTERIIRLVSAADTFCEESIVGEMPQSLAAQATRASLVLHLNERAVHDAMSADLKFARALIVRMSTRICDLVADIELCEQRNNAQRVAYYLVKHASRACDAVEVKLSTNKQTIASQLNMTPESFSRVLNRFTREGFILRRGHRAIRLTDLSGLQTLAA